MAEQKMIITIGREFCSGGAETGKKIAEYFGIPYYDKEIIDKTAKMLHFNDEVVADNDEKGDGFWSSFGAYQYNTDLYINDPALMMPIGLQIADAQFEILKQLAAKGSCVIVGRCSNIILKDEPDAVHFFVRADMSSRLVRAIKTYHVTEAEAAKLIKQTDKVRSSYYNKHTGEKWGDSHNYQLVIDDSAIGTDGAAKVAAAFIKERFNLDN